MTDKQQPDNSGSNPSDPFSSFNAEDYLRKRRTEPGRSSSYGDDEDEVGSRSRRRDVRREHSFEGEDFDDEPGEGLGEGLAMMGRGGEGMREGRGGRGPMGEGPMGEEGLLGGLTGGFNIVGWAIRIALFLFVTGFLCALAIVLLIASRH